MSGRALVLATRNPHKLREFARLLAPAGIAIEPVIVPAITLSRIKVEFETIERAALRTFIGASRWRATRPSGVPRGRDG